MINTVKQTTYDLFQKTTDILTPHNTPENRETAQKVAFCAGALVVVGLCRWYFAEPRPIVSATALPAGGALGTPIGLPNNDPSPDPISRAQSANPLSFGTTAHDETRNDENAPSNKGNAPSAEAATPIDLSSPIERTETNPPPSRPNEGSGDGVDVHEGSEHQAGLPPARANSLASSTAVVPEHVQSGERPESPAEQGQGSPDAAKNREPSTEPGTV